MNFSCPLPFLHWPGWLEHWRRLCWRAAPQYACPWACQLRLEWPAWWVCTQLCSAGSRYTHLKHTQAPHFKRKSLNVGGQAAARPWEFATDMSLFRDKASFDGSRHQNVKCEWGCCWWREGYGAGTQATMGEDDQEHKRHMRQKAFEAETSSGSRESPASWNKTSAAFWSGAARAAFIALCVFTCSHAYLLTVQQT